MVVGASGDVFAKGSFLASALDLAENFGALEPLDAGTGTIKVMVTLQ